MDTRQKWAIGIAIVSGLAPFATQASLYADGITQTYETPHILDVVMGGGINYLIAYGIGTLIMKANNKRKLRKQQSYSGAPLPPPNIN